MSNAQIREHHMWPTRKKQWCSVRIRTTCETCPVSRVYGTVIFQIAHLVAKSIFRSYHCFFESPLGWRATFIYYSILHPQRYLYNNILTSSTSLNLGVILDLQTQSFSTHMFLYRIILNVCKPISEIWCATYIRTESCEYNRYVQLMSVANCLPLKNMVILIALQRSVFSVNTATLR